MNAMNAGRDVHIVALADILLDRVQEKRSALKLKYPNQVEVPDENCFAGFDAYRHVIESCDVVIIACAAKFHSFFAKTAIEAGRHVFLEKPHAIDPIGIQRLRQAVDLARQKGLSLVSGLQSRYHPGYIETMQRVHDGAIGDIVAIQETWLRPRHAGSRIPGEQPVSLPLALGRRCAADPDPQPRPCQLGFG
jgi:predicted dehydrogenase